jgi:hypothetical protein
MLHKLNKFEKIQKHGVFRVEMQDARQVENKEIQFFGGLG